MAVDMFLKLDGIDGESTDAHHDKWIELESFSWGVSNPGGFVAGGGAGTGKPVPGDFNVVMPFSAASPTIFLKLVTGQAIDSAIISMRQAGGGPGGGADFLTYTFDTVFMTKLDWEGGADRPAEGVSFQFEKVNIDYHTTKVDGSLGDEIRASFDFLKFVGG
jgi:type VI secretion system secreted protein Hcp